ncbi:glycosyltransferase family 4 protein [Solirubrobacter ginsenosidimutans]|uniref:Glycosyltransferase family 4 protein n=1 Tax=Solirubrobacter ginsenosidimutans TaxID=490573 RepID=A0A9X3S3L5_9ACTN|nr:glycosyltransferase family 1 protein [Solirubrobacter ginsenosidimutans]MDA0164759.1 glycosyltransferase family 4 protein [Solirubrobacter ginsenosidimutans]
MRVAYDLTALQINSSGVARWITALRRALAARDEPEIVDIAQPQRAREGRVPHALLREGAWLPAGLANAARRTGADVLHCPAPLGPWRRGSVPVVLSIYDVMPLRRPEWFTAANRWHTRLVLPRIARGADIVLVPSAFSRDELLDEVPGLAPDRVVVVSGGVDAQFCAGPRPDAERPYLLTVGELQPRKNVETAIRAFGQLASQHPELELLVVGARGWGEAPVTHEIGSAAERVRFAGHVSDQRLVELYRGASALLFPSRYEGFGLPALEAMACGTPVVAARAASLPEVVGDAGLLVDPGDAGAWAAATGRLLDDADLVAELRTRGLARAARFTWHRCAEQTVAAYRQAAAA